MYLPIVIFNKSKFKSKKIFMKKEVNSFTKQWLFITVFVIIIFSSSFRYSYSQVTDTLEAVKDNTLYEDEFGLTSNGMGQHFFAGKTSSKLIRRGLVAFDVAGNLPPNSTITSVKLRLHLSKAVGGDRDVELRSVLADWGEGASHASEPEGQGAPSEAGDATWLHTYYDTVLWNRSGGDFSQTVSSSVSVGTFPDYYVWGSTTEMISDVQNWLDNPQDNFGWIVIGDESDVRDAKRFDSRNNDSLNFRPKLIVTYTSNNPGLNLTSMIEGFWNGTSMVSDTAKIFLRNSASPYSKVDSASAILNSSGNANISFTNAGSGSYYIVVTQRNSIETWSKLPQAFTAGNILNYNFTSASAQAYGDNLVLKSGKYCNFSGDVNQNGSVNGIDLGLTDNDAFNFVTGYVATDVNGDNATNALDLSITDNNAYNFVSKITPP